MRAKRNRIPRLLAPQDFHELGRHLFDRARIRGRGHAPIKPMGAPFVTCGVESYIRRIGGRSFRFAIFWRTAPIHRSLFLDAKKRSVVGEQDWFRNRHYSGIMPIACLSAALFIIASLVFSASLRPSNPYGFSRRNKQRSVSSAYT